MEEKGTGVRGLVFIIILSGFLIECWYFPNILWLAFSQGFLHEILLEQVITFVLSVCLMCAMWWIADDGKRIERLERKLEDAPSL